MHLDGTLYPLKLHGVDSNHPRISAILHQLGKIAQKQGEYEALKFYRKSLGMKKRIHGDDFDHPTISCTLNDPGKVAWKQRKVVTTPIIEIFRKL